MSACEDAYRVLGLNSDATFREVWYMYRSILDGEDTRSSGRKRTNMPAVHFAFQTILNQQTDGPLFGDEESEDDYYYDDDDDDDTYSDYTCNCPHRHHFTDDQLRETKFSRQRPRNEGYHTNTDGAAVEANASKLVKEEEAQKNENKKSDAKKKKKKKKKKKPVDNSSTSVNVNNNCSETRNENVQSDEDTDGEGLDLNSAFAKASGKAAQEKVASSNGNKTECRRPSSRPANHAYAMEGNQLAKKGEFLRAANVFTLAIKLDGNDHRFFGNRSFCFERLKQYDKALKDADRAIQIDPSWPKGFFRRGRALLGQLAALDALLRGDVRQLPDDSSDSEDDTGEPTAAGRPVDPKEDPSNVEGLRSLWVGNIMQTVTERDLRDLFARHGAVTSVRVLPDRYCAFVNFGDKKGASLAMQHLQGLEFHGNRLKIKFPDNPIVDGQAKVVIGKKGPVGAGAGGTRKLTGPVGDGECYFWRTSDCSYGTSCKYKHIAANKGIDRKPWRR
ncbi:Tetratricopeptide repeat protein 31 [Amphibalanus amphitrite]|uniref:Tetratricopeptide repeat protein 31 n=1 Tax=Amphibalanus amphitrite TaxID=1232801 RepID=A0A6A4WCQ7_AMPAM|nr:Tetratricopeptide repeat protein 31 [Amphibalanus amphitrite]KAF0305487.1 Tetratricopeptide repeat protein 31 [Amphibalanus amphitrite]